MTKLGLLALASIAASGITLVATASTPATEAPNCSVTYQQKQGQGYVVIEGNNIQDIEGKLKQYGIDVKQLQNNNCQVVKKPMTTPPQQVTPQTTTPQTTTPQTRAPETKAPGTTAPETKATENNANLSNADQVLKLVNAERAKVGAGALTYDSTIASAAMVRSKEITGSFSHTRPNGSSFSTALTEQGIKYRTSGENIAWGQKTPQAVMDAWMNSSGHRANILNASYTKIGIACYNASGTLYWTELFTG